MVLKRDVAKAKGHIHIANVENTQKAKIILIFTQLLYVELYNVITNITIATNNSS